jgi:hypothetical protein
MNTILILSTLLTLSVSVNVLLVLYLRGVLSKLLFVSENLGDLDQMLLNFNNHLTSVYELETFYGDDTLHHLLEHVGDLSEQLQEFEDIFSLTTEENIEVEQDTAEQPAKTTPA